MQVQWVRQILNSKSQFPYLRNTVGSILYGYQQVSTSVGWLEKLRMTQLVLTKGPPVQRRAALSSAATLSLLLCWYSILDSCHSNFLIQKILQRLASWTQNFVHLEITSYIVMQLLWTRLYLTETQKFPILVPNATIINMNSKLTYVFCT